MVKGGPLGRACVSFFLLLCFGRLFSVVSSISNSQIVLLFAVKLFLSTLDFRAIIRNFETDPSGVNFFRYSIFSLYMFSNSRVSSNDDLFRISVGALIYISRRS